MRPEFQFIIDMVQPYSYVLDLGCGSGELLQALQDKKHVRAQGIDVNEDAIQSCVAKGLFVYHGDLDEGLADFNDQSVDFVIATNTVQVLYRPDYLIREMARVGKNCIISVPNFAYWDVRLQLMLKGVMPKSKQIPYEWYNSPNIHLTTIKDFRTFCAKNNIRIVQEIAISTRGREPRVVSCCQNLLADYAIFKIEGRSEQNGSSEPNTERLPQK